MGIPDKIIKQAARLAEPGERVRLIREWHGWNQSELARRAGVKPQNIQQLEGGRVQQPRYIADLARALGVRVDLLLSRHNSVRDSVSNYDSGPVKVPLIGWDALGGLREEGGTVHDSKIMDYLPQPVDMGPRAFALRVEDNANAGKFHEGEIIWADPDKRARDKSFVIALLDDDRRVLRQLRETNEGRMLEAINPAWPERVRPLSDDDAIVGVVVFKGEPV